MRTRDEVVYNSSCQVLVLIERTRLGACLALASSIPCCAAAAAFFSKAASREPTLTVGRGDVTMPDSWSPTGALLLLLVGLRVLRLGYRRSAEADDDEDATLLALAVRKPSADDERPEEVRLLWLVPVR